MKHSKYLIFNACKISKEELDNITTKDWTPVKLEKKTTPKFLQGIPDGKVISMFGSSSIAQQNPLADGNPDFGQIGGIDVYRFAEEKDGVKMNKDWYTIFSDPYNKNQFYVIGPKRDKEHWIDDIPERLKRNVILVSDDLIK